jgi:DNA helicase-2/ATP-dependent DNA helicase PcrA
MDRLGGNGDWIDELNSAQREAVTHGSGPLLVVAGAGTGKTRTLACRVAHVIDRGAPPERILLLTFTRRAAAEMLARAARLIERPSDPSIPAGPIAPPAAARGAGRVWGGTFHAVANRLLRHHGRAVGVRPDFTVMDQADAADLMNLIRGELGLAERSRRFPRKETLAAIYSRMINAASSLGEVLERDFPWCLDERDGIRSVFESYTERKRQQNVLDFDDLLLYWNALARAELRSAGRTGTAGRTGIAGLGDLFDHILVDEYQDTNALQAEILQGMRACNQNLTVVGDDTQSIYAFRSATVRNILEFPDRFPGTRIVKLEQNYRSTQPLLDASNAVIALSSQRHAKTLWSARKGERRPALVTCLDEAEQCDEVCRSVLAWREQGIALKQQAVLFRAAHHSDQLEVELTRRNIQFVKYGGLRFLEAAHVKDVLATLRILENPWDEISWFRVLQLLDGVGPVAAGRLLDELGVRRRPRTGSAIDPAGGSPLRRMVESPPDVPPSAREGFDVLRLAVDDCAAPGLGPSSQIERLRAFLEPVFDRRYQRVQSRIHDVEQLEHIAGRYPTRARFISDLTLDPPASTGDLAGPPLLDEDYLILSTIHSAKGCEWDVVHLIHAADGMMPSDMATRNAEEIEEERRLFYVALTRAKDALSVTFPLRYYHRPRGFEDGHSYAQLTRFLPHPVRSLFDQRAAPGVASSDDDAPEAAPAGRGGRAQVDAYLARLLRS